MHFPPTPAGSSRLSHLQICFCSQAVSHFVCVCLLYNTIHLFTIIVLFAWCHMWISLTYLIHHGSGLDSAFKNHNSVQLPCTRGMGLWVKFFPLSLETWDRFLLHFSVSVILFLFSSYILGGPNKFFKCALSKLAYINCTNNKLHYIFIHVCAL